MSEPVPYTLFAGTRNKGALGVGEWRHFVGHYTSPQEAYEGLLGIAMEQYELTGPTRLQRERYHGPVRYNTLTFEELT
jgi:hypothetical protein